MKRSILFILVLCTNMAMAQYCGSSGPNICNTTTTLTSPGITDYTTFPCIHDSIPYNETMQIYFPGMVSEMGFNVTIDSIRIDSITNLPCGMCWAANDPSFTYPGLGRACINFSGTTYDSVGAYQLNLYGTAYTSFGTFPGNLSLVGLSFYLNVVKKNASCTPIDTTHLFIACMGPDTSVHVSNTTQPNVTQCNFQVNLSATPVIGCSYDSTTISILQPSGPGYHYYWGGFNIQGSGISYIADSTTSSFTYNPADVGSQLVVKDSTGCGDTISFDMTVHSGPVVFPSICYGTTDTSLAWSYVTFVFERDNFFNNINSYTLFRQDSAPPFTAGVNIVGTSLASSYGYIVDSNPHPIDTTNNYCAQCNMNTYHLGYTTTCQDTEINNPNLFVSSVLMTYIYQPLGVPYLYWTNSDPLNYDTVYVFSRNANGNWVLRYSTSDLSTQAWIDNQPDSTGMQYMLGYHLIIDCDPTLRSANHYAFSNFIKISISPSAVVHDTTVHTGIVNKGSNINTAIYPNPANSKLFVQTNASGLIDMNIYDMEGRLMMSKQISGNQTNEINVEGLDADVYMVSLSQNGAQIAVKRFAKQ